MNQRRSTSKEKYRVVDQLKKWCAQNDRVALRITGQFFDLVFGGHLQLGPQDGSFVFQSSQAGMVSSIVPDLFRTAEIRQKDDSATVTMKRDEGQVTLIEIDTLADLLTALPYDRPDSVEVPTTKIIASARILRIKS
jgi:hypothetical protein